MSADGQMLSAAEADFEMYGVIASSTGDDSRHPAH
jgi:hypothetical protein